MTSNDEEDEDREWDEDKWFEWFADQEWEMFHKATEKLKEPHLE